MSTETYLITESCLEMRSRPDRAGMRVAPQGLDIRLIEEPTVALYRSVFTEVGRPWRWLNRMQLSDDELRSQLLSPGHRLYLPYMDGRWIGIVELSFGAFPEVELMYFGLAPGYIGRGIGSYLLDWLVALAWDEGAERLWLKTCTDDSSLALRAYERVGFRVFERFDKAKTYDSERW